MNEEEDILVSLRISLDTEEALVQQVEWDDLPLSKAEFIWMILDQAADIMVDEVRKQDD